jgi:hypothetical protein
MHVLPAPGPHHPPSLCPLVEAVPAPHHLRPPGSHMVQQHSNSQGPGLLWVVPAMQSIALFLQHLKGSEQAVQVVCGQRAPMLLQLLPLMLLTCP